MNRYLPYAAGPEMVWALLYLATVFLVLRNQPPTTAGNQQLELVGWFLPLIGVVLSFVTLVWAPGNQWWWLARIALAGLVGVCVVTAHLCGGIDYGDSRNSGVGSGFVLFIALGWLALFIGIVIATFFFLTKWRFVPFLKWTLIVFAVLAALWGIICWLASMGKPNSP